VIGFTIKGSSTEQSYQNEESRFLTNDPNGLRQAVMMDSGLWELH
jgi:hypothetical protein